MLGPSRSHASSSWEEGKQEAKELETSAVHLCPAPYRDYVVSHFKRRRRQWHPTPVLVPGKSYGRRSLVGCSPWGRKESDTTQRLHFHFSLSCIGEGNGNPLQCSCPENPRDGGAWRAAVYGVAQSQPRLTRLSNSSSIQEIAHPASTDTTPSIIFIKSTGHRRKYNMVSFLLKSHWLSFGDYFGSFMNYQGVAHMPLEQNHKGPQKGPWLKDTRFFLFLAKP